MPHQLTFPRTTEDILEENKQLKIALNKMLNFVESFHTKLESLESEFSFFTYGEYGGDDHPDTPAQIAGMRELACDHEVWETSKYNNSYHYCEDGTKKYTWENCSGCGKKRKAI